MSQSSVQMSSADNLQARQKVLARMRACAVSYQPSLLERKVLYFFFFFSDHLSVLCSFLSVNNQLSIFVSTVNVLKF